MFVLSVLTECAYMCILCRMWTVSMHRGRVAVTPMFLQLRSLRMCGKGERLISPQIMVLTLTIPE